MYISTIKVKNEKLKGSKLNGSFLYEKNGDFYFTNYIYHAVFELDKDYKNNDETKNYLLNFDEYVQKFLQICPEFKNKPSLLFLNYAPKNIVKVLGKSSNEYKFIDLISDEDYKNFNEKSCVTCVLSDISSVLRKLVEMRSDAIPQNDVFVFFNEPEYYHNLRSPFLDTILTVSRSRKIYFVLNFVDKSKYIQEYGPDSYQIIKDDCNIKFICNCDGVADIQLN